MKSISKKMMFSKLTWKFSVAILFFYAFQTLNHWQIMSAFNANGGVLYGDANIVLTYTECYAQFGTNVFNPGTNCSNWANGGSLLAVLSWFGITNSATNAVGYIYTVSLVIIFIICFYILRSNKFAQGTLFIGSISPPVWLLIERANFDSLIFIFVFTSVYMFYKDKIVTSIFLIFLASLFKFYTLPLLLLVFFLTKKFYTKLVSLLTFIMGTGLVVLDLSRIENLPHTAGYNHFGMRIVGNYLGKLGIDLSIFMANLLGAFLICICSLSLIIFIKSKNITIHSFVPKETLGKYLFQFVSVVYLSCFVAGLSVDYRLIFFIIGLPFTIQTNHRWLKFILIGAYSISLYLSYPAGNLQPLGDLSLGILSSWLTIITLSSTIFLNKNNKISTQDTNH